MMISARGMLFLCMGWIGLAFSARATIVQIQFANLAPLSFECGTPATAACGSPTFEAFDSTQPDLGVGHALADTPAGTLKAELTAAPPSATTGGSYSLSISVLDTVMISGPPSSSPVPGTAVLSVNGTGLAPFLDSDTPEPGGQSFGFVRAFVGEGGFDAFVFSTSPLFSGCCTVAAGMPFPVSLQVAESFSAMVGVPQFMRYQLVLQGANGTHLDLLNTAQLSFSLPPGYSIQSTGGFAQEAAGAVPEPSDFALTLLTIGVILRYRAKRTLWNRHEPHLH